MKTDEPVCPDMKDVHGRALTSLRLSVIDRCDLRCAYCMPEEGYRWLPTDDILTFDEIERTVDAFAEVGVRKVRLTGGEPLLRGGIDGLVERLAAKESVRDLALTTNGTQLAKWAAPLRRAGLHRVTVSLDSLKPARFETLTRRAALEQVLDGIREAGQSGFREVKINTVVIRDFNDDELIDLIEFGREVGSEVRFIEYMDVGGATLWSMARVVPKSEVLARISAHFGDISVEEGRGTAPAERYVLADGTRFGVVASTTVPFCQTCDRSPVTADGMWYLCLYARDGVDLRQLLRDGISSHELTERIRSVWRTRTDRGAEDREADPLRGALYEIEELSWIPTERCIRAAADDNCVG